jgi:L-alanine-DL-glutamate epimerase-like enolase superfamily enzyme
VTLSFDHEVLRLGLRDPFLIARSDHGGGHAVTTVVIELRDQRFPDVVGLGEGYPDRYYGETQETLPVVIGYLIDAVGEFEASPEGLRAASERLEGAIRWNGAAKCALDTALHDLVGKVTGEPVHRLLGLSAEIPPTDFTLGLDEPKVVAERARRAGAFPALKIKVGGPADLATLEAVREVYDKPIRVDANTGWTPEGARRSRGRAHRAALSREPAGLAP